MSIIIPVEKLPLLVAVNPVVGGVEVEDQRLGRLIMGGDEPINQDLCHAEQGLTGDAVFKGAKCGRRGERNCLVGDLTSGDLEWRIDAEILVVVEILVAEGDRDNSLSQHGLLFMGNQLM
jgi:hypothetical protein